MQPKGSVDVLMEDYAENQKYLEQDNERSQFFAIHYREEDERASTHFEDVNDVNYLFEDDNKLISSLIDD
jgi:hypothetical protein